MRKMTNWRRMGTALVLGGLAFSAQAQEEVRDLGTVVVTGNKFETPIEKSGKVIYKITAEQIKSGQTVADILNTLPGINVDGAFGAPGTNLDYSIRGGRNRHTLILVDGMPISDPSSIANDYDLRLLNANNIESIEVLKGGASTLYGSGAATGVINITMKKPDNEKPQVTLSQTIGSFQTGNTYGDVQGRSGQLSYLVSGSLALSEGFSAAQDNDPNVEFGDDGFRQYTGGTKLSYEFSDYFTLGASLAYENVRSDYDNGAFLDADNEFSIRQIRYGINPRLTYNGGSLELKLNYNRIRREFISAFPSTAKGKSIQGDLTNQFNIGDRIKAIGGVQFQDFKFESGTEEPGASNFDPYFNIAADITNSLSITTGLRLNNNSEYGSNLVYNINPSYLIDMGNENKLKLFGSISTAFVAPSLFQLFADFFGNTDLEAEETESLEFGLSLYLSEKLTLNAQYFDRTETNAIDFVSQFDDDNNFIGGSYENIAGDREIDGIEIDLSWEPTEDLRITGHFADYNFGDPTQFFRLPDQKYGLGVQYSVKQGTTFGLIHNHFSERQAAIFSDPFLVNLDSYDLIDFNFSHELFDGNLILNGAINNILDEDFIGVYGFATRPVNFSIGFTAIF